MDDELDPAPHLLADRLVRQPDAGHQRQRLEPAQRIGGRVRVHGRQRAVVAGVERGQQVERLGPAHLADHDPVGPHAQRVAKQVADRHLAPPLDARRPALEPHHVRLAQAKLGRVLDRDHPLARRRCRPDSALSRVVFPDPVPPEIRMLRRASHRGGEQVAKLGGQGARGDQLVGVRDGRP